MLARVRCEKILEQHTQVEVVVLRVADEYKAGDEMEDSCAVSVLSLCSFPD